MQATPSWSEPLILWLALVGAPSTGKSPALDQARQLLDAVEAEAKEGDEERRRLSRDERRGRQGRGRYLARGSRHSDEGEHPRPVKPAEACQVGSFVPTQFVVGDTTIESIVDVVKGNPRGVVLWRDELTGWLMNVARYGGGNDRPFWLERWSAASAHRQPQEPAARPHPAPWSLDRRRYPAGPPRGDLCRGRRRHGRAPSLRIPQSAALHVASATPRRS